MCYIIKVSDEGINIDKPRIRTTEIDVWLKLENNKTKKKKKKERDKAKKK